MWHIVLTINSVLWVIAMLYLVYAAGQLFIIFAWKEFLLALVVVVFLSLAEVALAAMNMW